MMAEALSPPDAPKPTECCRWPLWSHGERPAYGQHRFCDTPAYDFPPMAAGHPKRASFERAARVPIISTLRDTRRRIPAMR
jgi:hypothetical protein